jgi:hypothetical protein
VAVRIGLDHGPHARWRDGAADEVEVVADGAGADMGDDGTGHGKGSGRMSFGARLARRETVGWRDRAKPVLNAILLVFDQF